MNNVKVSISELNYTPIDYSKIISSINLDLEYFYNQINYYITETSKEICEMINNYRKNYEGIINSTIDLQSIINVAMQSIDYLSIHKAIKAFGEFNFENIELAEVDIAINDVDNNEESFDIMVCLKRLIEKLNFILSSDMTNKKGIEVILYCILMIIQMICAANSCVSFCDFSQGITQQIISHINEWDMKYYVYEEEGAKIYLEPNSKSKVIARLNYGDIITEIDNQRLWIQFEYVQKEGTIVQAWIAKRNLISYDKVEFNSEELPHELYD